ncbi:anaerobic ribonucleoside-triphosphate reductase [Candidatus Parabeggiatoa sp. HSG14]|uniref:anaerobic ribonucleoside-triphosphate reductase n=1 Tax=Candidatus Parabeggiatoa sp. HSG14 TaxID=3055593 RepID=UPI0025A8878B|nr:anaerobic ribonucleoside-triphosphate reductase [Thiotrichales bacterium HSG14]
MSQSESLYQKVSPTMNHCLTDSKGQLLLKDSERTRTEIWTRVMGYHRPVSAFNPGKQSEHSERQHFKESCTHASI